jgi:hypothetical protein
MQIRLVGTDAECQALTGRLRSIADVQEVDGPRARRGGGKLVSYYITAAVDVPKVVAEVTVVNEPAGPLDRRSVRARPPRSIER